jgi:hypothetical protein
MPHKHETYKSRRGVAVMDSKSTDGKEDGRIKAAARWWSQALAEKRAWDEAAITAKMPASLLPYPISRHQVEAFEIALEQYIRDALQDGLPHVLCANHGHASSLLCKAAEKCGISDLCYRLPDQVIMRIFPNTVMVGTGPLGSFQIVWSNDTVTYGKQCTGPGTQQRKVAA